jgi:malonate-semialdehyde dehydrogenase (acetylating)/methylmalonate-semialdehyde dehydrogenase
MIKHFIAGKWESSSGPSLPIFDPATGEVIDEVPLASADEASRAIDAAALALPAWSRVPVMERTQLMFDFKSLLEDSAEDLAEVITRHHGKTLDEARGEVRRGIEVVDFACGAPSLAQGRTLRQVHHGVDQEFHRFPIGVVAGITPFNFPVMIPLWMFPLAVVLGNTFVLKPSEKTPLGAVRLGELFAEAGFPDGVFNVIHGANEVVTELCTHRLVSAVSFVGSEPVAHYVYSEAAKHGKRVQAAGGAKNHIVVMPDADLNTVVPAVLNSAFGNAGERCLAGSVVVGIDNAYKALVDAISNGAEQLVVGPGSDPSTDVGPLIRDEHRQRVLGYVERGASEGARVIVDGRKEIERPGFFLGPTILEGVSPEMVTGREEIFGPVLSMARSESLRAAIETLNEVTFGNMAAIFTSSGQSAREFRESAQAGMIGVNVGVAQPLAFFPFSGWRDSFYGDLHLHGTDGVDFYTRKKVIVSRW